MYKKKDKVRVLQKSGSQEIIQVLTDHLKVPLHALVHPQEEARDALDMPQLPVRPQSNVTHTDAHQQRLEQRTLFDGDYRVLPTVYKENLGRQQAGVDEVLGGVEQVCWGMQKATRVARSTAAAQDAEIFDAALRLVAESLDDVGDTGEEDQTSNGRNVDIWAVDFNAAEPVGNGDVEQVVFFAVATVASLLQALTSTLSQLLRPATDRRGRG